MPLISSMLENENIFIKNHLTLDNLLSISLKLNVSYVQFTKLQLQLQLQLQLFKDSQYITNNQSN